MKTFYLELYRRAYCVTYTYIEAASKEDACRIAMDKYHDILEVSIDKSPRMPIKNVIKNDLFI